MVHFWNNVCLPKDFGGLGILNTRLMNEALLTKWVWRILNNGEDDICCQLLRAKYLRRKSLQQCRGDKGSQFWKGINKVKGNFKWGGKSIVNNGRDTSFWEDVWVGEVPLKLLFPKIYEFCRDKKCSVAECWGNNECTMDLKRSLNLEEAAQWEALMDTIKDIQINRGADKVVWVLEKSGIYSTKSMYRMLAHRGVVNYQMRRVWESKLPLKIKIFLWQAIQDRLQTRVNLKERGWKGNRNCVICNKPETTDHILFKCIVAKFTWTCIREALSLDSVPTGMQDMLETWARTKHKHAKLTIFCCAIILWGIWTTRNKFTIEGLFPSHPSDVLFKIQGFLQRWAALLRGVDKTILEDLIKKMKDWRTNFLKEIKRHSLEDSLL